jgi:hypothetical protein
VTQCSREQGAGVYHPSVHTGVLLPKVRPRGGYSTAFTEVEAEMPLSSLRWFAEGAVGPWQGKQWPSQPVPGQNCTLPSFKASFG